MAGSYCIGKRGKAILYVNKGSNKTVFLHDIKNFRANIAVFPGIMTISTDLAILNSMLRFVLKYWLNWKILVAIV